MAEVIGLTGQTGAGKSTVRKLLKAKGAAVIDADSVAHEVADNSLSCLTDIVEHFSCMVLDEKGKLNRRALGRIVFSDRKKLALLNKIMFPYIVSAIKGQVTAYEQAGAQIIVIDGATLIESGCAKMCSVLVSVTADEETRLTRIIHRDGISKRGRGSPRFCTKSGGILHQSLRLCYKEQRHPRRFRAGGGKGA